MFFTASGYSISSVAPYINNTLLWKIIGSFYLGIIYHVLVIIIENAIFNIPININIIFLNFFTAIIIGCLITKIKMVPQRIEKVSKRDLPVIFLVLLIFITALSARGDYIGFTITPKRKHNSSFKKRLMDIDPHRHYIRTKLIYQKQRLIKFDPYIVKKLPIRNMEGCYVLNVIIIKLFDYLKIKLDRYKDNIWIVCKYFPPLIGASSILSFFLLISYLFPKQKMPALLSTAFLAVNPLHIIRTNIFFTSSYAWSFVPLVWLFFLQIFDLSMEPKKWHPTNYYIPGIFLGAGLTCLSSFNLFVLENTLWVMFLFIILWISVVSFKKRGFKNKLAILNFTIAIIIFLAFLVFWISTYLGENPYTLVKTHTRYSSHKFTNTKISYLLSALWLSTQNLYPSFILKDFKNLNFENFIWTFPWFTIASLSFLFQLYSMLKKPHKYFLGFSFSFPVIVTLSPLLFLPLLLKEILPSFVSKPYRYFVISSYGFSILAAMGYINFWELVNAKLKKRVSPFILRIVFTLICIEILLYPKVYAKWTFSFSEGDYAACQWINTNIPEKSIIAVTFNEGELIRSETERNIIHIIWQNPEYSHFYPVIKNAIDLLNFAKDVNYPIYLYVPYKYKKLIYKYFINNYSFYFIKVFPVQPCRENEWYKYPEIYRLSIQNEP
jgi:hypothetical protein